jgi:hypothetical protein
MFSYGKKWDDMDFLWYFLPYGFQDHPGIITFLESLLKHIGFNTYMGCYLQCGTPQ